METRHERPEYVTRFNKPVNTEIKYISGKWYLYERASLYDPQTRSSRKVSGKLLGSITEKGFVPRKLKAEDMLAIEVKEYGASRYFGTHSPEIIAGLKEFFPSLWREIYATALMRLLYGKEFSRVGLHYECSFLSETLPGLSLSPGAMTPLLRRLGMDRGAIKGFLSSFCRERERFVLIDGHRILSSSRGVDNAAPGYDSKCRYQPQVNLIYMFSLGNGSSYPEYYKQYMGSIPDVSAFCDIIAESETEGRETTVVADKGFGSDGNFEALENGNLKYIIPLKRGNLYVKDAIPASQAGYDTAFTYQGRNVFAKTFGACGPAPAVHLFLDSWLLDSETADLITRAGKKNDDIGLRARKENRRRERNLGRLSDGELAGLVPCSVTGMLGSRPGAGTLCLRTNRTDLNSEQVYCIYKQRQAIEQFFKTYDDTLGYDDSYMHNDYSLEAWFFINHICMMMGVEAIQVIARAGKAKEYSLKDLVATLRKVKAVKVGKKWYVSKTTRHVDALCEKLGIKLEDGELTP